VVRTVPDLQKAYAEAKGDAKFYTTLQLSLAEAGDRTISFNAKHFPLVKTTSYHDALVKLIRPIKTVAVVGASGRTGVRRHFGRCRRVPPAADFQNPRRLLPHYCSYYPGARP